MHVCEHRCQVGYLIFERDICKHLLTQNDKVEYNKDWQFIVLIDILSIRNTRDNAEGCAGLPASTELSYFVPPENVRKPDLFRVVKNGSVA